MKPGSIGEWLRPTLGAVLMLAGAAALAYKVLSGYQHPAPESFVSFEDRNKLPAAPAEVQPAHAAPSNLVPPVEDKPASGITSRGPWEALSPADAPHNSACSAIKTEQHEIGDAFGKPHSQEEARYLLRRQRDLAEQSLQSHCVK